MKVKQVIKLLSELDPEESIVIAFWEKGAFEGILQDDDDWEAIAHCATDEADWSQAHEDIIAHIEMFQKFNKVLGFRKVKRNNE